MSPKRGFTLLEVLVALVIVAFGMGALMATLTSAADAVGHLRDKSFAEWVALNRISEVRLLETRAPAVGETRGESDYAGLKWQWTQKVERTGLADMIRIDVTVSRKAEAGADAPPALATAAGFIGGSLRPASAAPDWSGGDLEQIRIENQQKQQPEPGPQPQPQPQPNTPSPIDQPGARQ